MDRQQTRENHEKDHPVNETEHDVGETQCSRCVHACALSVERSYTCVRCGNPASANFGKWTRAWNYRPRRCGDCTKVAKGDQAYDDAFAKSCEILQYKIMGPRIRRKGEPGPEGPAIPADVDPETYRAYVPIEREGR